MERIDAGQKDQLRRIVEFCTGVDMKWALPRVALKKAVLRACMAARLTAMGRRITEAWLREHCKTSVIDWGKRGVYKLKVEGGAVTKNRRERIKGAKGYSSLGGSWYEVQFPGGVTGTRNSFLGGNWYEEQLPGG